MDDVCTLIKTTSSGFDDYGNIENATERRDVFCQVYSITRSEFYSAATSNIHPEFTIMLSDYSEYEGETLVEYNDVLYEVIRTYRDRSSMGHRRSGNYVQNDINSIELIIGRKIGDGKA